MAETTRLRLLGTVQVERDGETLHGFRSRKALALLGYLAGQEQPIPRERLADLFWEGMPEARGRANLSWVLSRISTLLRGCLLADRHSGEFQRNPATWLDLVAYCELEAQGGAASLAKAVALYRGEFLLPSSAFRRHPRPSSEDRGNWTRLPVSWLTLPSGCLQ